MYFCDINESVTHFFCRTEHPVIEVYPGERFNVSVIIVGQLNGSTPGRVKATLEEK